MISKKRADYDECNQAIRACLEQDGWDDPGPRYEMQDYEQSITIMYIQKNSLGAIFYYLDKKTLDKK